MQNTQTAEILTRFGLFYNRLIHKIKTLFTSNKNAPVILCRKDNDREIYKFDSLYKASKEMWLDYGHLHKAANWKVSGVKWWVVKYL